MSRLDESASAPAGAGAAHRTAADRTATQDTPATSPDSRRGPAGLVARATALAAWFARTRAGRANARFGSAGGGVLTGGIAYATLFSVFAALTLGFSVFMAVLGGNEALRTAVVGAVAAALPGIVDTGDGEGLIDPTTLHLSTGFTLAGVIALVTLVLSAMSAVAALQTGLRAMFGITSGGNAVLGKLRQLAATAGLALTVLVAAVLTLAVTTVAQGLLEVLGWSAGAEVLVRVLAPVVSFGVDAALFVLLVRVLTAAHPARRDLWGGALIAAVGLGAARVLGTSVVAGSVGGNPLLAPFAAVVVLLVWVNLAARILLLAAAWTADPASPAERPTSASHVP